MNYRHAFHAGNFADVFKHAILARILVYLGRKEAAFRFIDTHAGEGLYDLSGERAERTAEWRAGIGRFLEVEPAGEVKALLEPYLDAVLPALRGAAPLYPGSPALAARLSRPQDRLIFCDADPEVIAALAARREFARDRRVKIIEIDGYMALKAFVPPRERRGLVLIDPPFESRDEFAQLNVAFQLAVQKWPTGIYMAWFPIKDTAATAAFLKAACRVFAGLGSKKALFLRLALGQPSPDGPLAASGLMILNPPFTLEVEARIILPYLARTMANMGSCDVEVAWLDED